MIEEPAIFEMGNGLRFWCREGTNDSSTVFASAFEDEYELADEDVSGKLVFDVGAYLGSVGIWLATRGARVVCFEPVPENAELIRRNAELNGVDVVVLEAAAGADGEQIVRWGFLADPSWNDDVAAGLKNGELHTDQTRETIEHHGFVGVTHPNAPLDQIYKVKVVPSLSLTTASQKYGVPDVIKIDCEGGEWAWLMDPAVRAVRLITGEWHPFDNESGTEGIGGFRKKGYAYSRDSVRTLVGDTHDLEFSGPEGGPGGFRATLR